MGRGKPDLATFLFQARTAVDILAVAPFYVTLIAAAPGSGGGAAGAALRVVRVLRVVRLFKLGRYVTWMRIFTRTLLDALPALGSERPRSAMHAPLSWRCAGPCLVRVASTLRATWASSPPAVLLFMATLAAIVFASLGYYAERGEWSAARGEWVRPDDSRSPFQVRPGAPHGRTSWRAGTPPCLPSHSPSPRRSGSRSSP